MLRLFKTLAIMDPQNSLPHVALTCVSQFAMLIAPSVSPFINARSSGNWLADFPISIASDIH